MLCSHWPFFPNLSLNFSLKQETLYRRLSFNRPQKNLHISFFCFLRKKGTASSSKIEEPARREIINKYSMVETLSFFFFSCLLKFEFFVDFEEKINFYTLKFHALRRFSCRHSLPRQTNANLRFLSSNFKLNQFLTIGCRCSVAAMTWSAALAHKLRHPSKAWTSALAIWSPDWIMHRERDMVRWIHETASRRQSGTCWTAAVHSKRESEKYFWGWEVGFASFVSGLSVKLQL